MFFSDSRGPFRVLRRGPCGGGPDLNLRSWFIRRPGRPPLTCGGYCPGPKLGIVANGLVCFARGHRSPWGPVLCIASAAGCVRRPADSLVLSLCCAPRRWRGSAAWGSQRWLPWGPVSLKLWVILVWNLGLTKSRFLLYVWGFRLARYGGCF